MRGALLLVAAAALVAGCGTTVDATFDPAHDFGRYRTYDWLADGRGVDALPTARAGLDALTTRLVGRELEDRGLVRVDGRADLLVGYQLHIKRSVVTRNETGAHNLVSSHHASPSYLVQATTTRTEVYDDATLSIVVMDARGDGQVVWQGDLSTRQPGDFARYLPEAVSKLLGQLPIHPLATGNSSAPDAR